MGAYSELDISRRYDSDLFTEDDPEKTQAAIQSPTPIQDSGTDTAKLPDSDNKPTAPTAVGTDDDEKRKAHEESEDKRKAEFDARQQAKKAAMQEQLDRLNAMSDDEVMAAAMKQVGADTEKLTRRNMKECVAEHIQTLCLADPAFARKVSHPNKSMIRCFQHISRKAWDYVQDELKANGIRPGPGQEAYGCDVPDDLCYQWAEDYFNDPDAKEDHEDEEKFVPRSYHGGSTPKSRSKSKGKTANDKTSAPKKADTKKSEQKPVNHSGQLSLGGFMMPEEKAG